MHLLIAAVLGVIQGLTEFLPISSTAHLLVGARLLGFDDPGGMFTVMIQLGSILAVMWLYRAKIVDVITGLPSDPGARRFAAAIVVAFLPALVAGALVAGFVKRVLYHSFTAIAVAFIAGGIVMLIVEWFRPRPVILEADRTDVPRAFGIGVAQTLALIPGVSRSGATIVGGMLAGLEKPAAAEFSFFLAMPTMMAAFAHDLWEIRHQLTFDRGSEIIIGFVMAFIASFVVVKPFLKFVGRAGFAPFAWYRIAFGAAMLVALAMGLL